VGRVEWTARATGRFPNTAPPTRALSTWPLTRPQGVPASLAGWPWRSRRPAGGSLAAPASPRPARVAVQAPRGGRLRARGDSPAEAAGAWLIGPSLGQGHLARSDSDCRPERRRRSGGPGFAPPPAAGSSESGLVASARGPTQPPRRTGRAGRSPSRGESCWAQARLGRTASQDPRCCGAGPPPVGPAGPTAGASGPGSGAGAGGTGADPSPRRSLPVGLGDGSSGAVSESVSPVDSDM
jgi:hypothetical protein